MTRDEQLKQIYQGSFKNRPRFDDGGGVGYDGSVSYFSPSPSAQYYATDGSGGYQPQMPAITVNSGSSYTPSASAPVTLNAADNPSSNSAVIGSTIKDPQAIASEDPLIGVGGDMSGAATNGTSGSSLAKALAALGLGGGNNSNSGILNAVAGILGAVGAYKNAQPGKGANAPAFAAPALFGGAAGTAAGSQAGTTSTGYGPAGGYNYANYPASSGYAARTQAPAMPKASYYTYGSGPEAQFFQQVNPQGGSISPVTSQARGGSIRMAAGGALSAMSPPPVAPGPPAQMQGMAPPPSMAPPSQGQAPMQQPMPPNSVPPQGHPMAAQQMPPNSVMPSVMSQRMQAARPAMLARGGQPPQGALQAVSHGSGPEMGSRYIQGPGDGTSDDIDARLAKGEYVMDSQSVSMLGNGDNEAGANKLDEFRKKLRQHKGGALSKGRMAPDAKPVEHYMGAK